MTVINLPATQKLQGYLQANVLSIIEEVAALPVQTDGSKGTLSSLPVVQQAPVRPMKQPANVTHLQMAMMPTLPQQQQ